MSILKTLTVGLFLILPTSLFGQLSSLEFDLRLLNPDAQMFPLGDLGFIAQGEVPAYFAIDMFNTGEGNLANLVYRVGILFNGQELASAESDPFTLPAGFSGSFNSRQLSEGVAVGSSTIRIDDYDVNLGIVTDLEDQVLQTGSLPAGSYEFNLTAQIGPTGAITEGPVADADGGNHTLFITNPTTIDLLFPGQSASSGLIEEITTQYPFFQFYSDINPQTANYNFTVYEKYAEDVTIQDVLNNPPILRVEGLRENFFQFPAESSPVLVSGQLIGPARVLDSGRTYYWQVESSIETGTNPIVLSSDVFRFRIAETATADNYDPRLLAFLEQILGSSFIHVLEQLSADGYHPSGNIFLDGNDVDVNELLSIISRIIQQRAVVKSAETF